MRTESLFKLLAFICLMGASLCTSGQIYFDTARSVKVFGTINDVININVNWIADPGAESHTLWSRQADTSAWDSLAVFSATDTTYAIDDLPANQPIEYRVIKKAGDINGYGYLHTGREIEAEHLMGRLLILIESESFNRVQETLGEYGKVLISEGWMINIEIVDKNATVAEVKQIIIEKANIYSDLRSLLILGDVPVPHSGDINPDAHLDHKGAWSADLFYGDLDGSWTDTEVSNTSSDNPRNHNIPGDGRLDQSFIPSDIELEVGRVDFSELPSFTADEYQLLDRYLKKDINYRTKVFSPVQRAAIKQTNQWQGGLGQNGFRNFSPLVSPDSIKTDVFSDGFSRSYQWFYGGGSGTYTSATFMGNTGTFASDSLQFIFTSFFGSYFGDYDYVDNYLRAALGSGTVLSAAWVGAPHWFYHPMGMGKTLGYCTKLTQNNADKYSGGFFPRSVHTNLLGDPTLKAYIVAPPSELSLAEVIHGVDLSWSASTDADRYHVYRKPAGSEDYFEQLGTVGFTSYADFCTPEGLYEYLVRAEKLEVTPSGSYYNLSSGITATISASGEYPVMADFEVVEQNGQFTTINNSTGATNFTWILPSGLFRLGENVIFELAHDSINLITLIAKNPCRSDTLVKEVILTNSTNYQDLAISLYPNPVSGKLTVVGTERQMCAILDAAGATILQFLMQGNKPTDIDVSDLSTGVYFMKLIGNRSSSHVRFIKI